MNQYTATFANGATVTRNSKRSNYTHAYRAVDNIGQTHMGFASSAEKALRTGKATLCNPGTVEVVEAVRS